MKPADQLTPEMAKKLEGMTEEERSAFWAQRYQRSKGSRQRFFQKHKAKIYAERKVAHDKNPITRWATQLRIKWGLTPDDFERMLAAQGGVCAICRGPERSIDPRTKALRRFAIDHCHDTNRIRGLLCSHCNRALGLFGDNLDLLERARNYLKEKA